MAIFLTDQFSQRHTGLAARLGAITSSYGETRDIALADAGEIKTVSHARAIFLSRGAEDRIERGGDRFLFSYREPNGESAIAALVAMLFGGHGPVAADPASLAVVALARRLAQSDIPVLINGPTGTGKEVLSNFIHRCSDRSDKPFIGVNCAAIPETMLEAMLFGHEKGAFTGANAAGEGFFRAADGGTLLLDEIAEMPLALQAKLLRALQEGEVVPVGATRPVKVDVRIIACANRDLPLEVEEGRFRADLYYRLNVFPIAIAALRDRPGDIAPLAYALALRHAPKGAAQPWIADEALALLRAHPWPGNVRELENVIRRALLLSQGRPAIEAEHIVFDTAPGTSQPTATIVPLQMLRPSTGASEPQRLAKVVQLSEARAIINTLEKVGGHRASAARELGISERTLRYRLASFRDAGIAVGAAR